MQPLERDRRGTKGNLPYTSHQLGLVWRNLPADSLLLTHSGKDSDEDIGAVLKSVLELLAHRALWHLDVILGGSASILKTEVTFVDVHLDDKGYESHSCKIDCL